MAKITDVKLDKSFNETVKRALSGNLSVSESKRLLENTNKVTTALDDAARDPKVVFAMLDQSIREMEKTLESSKDEASKNMIRSMLIQLKTFRKNPDELMAMFKLLSHQVSSNQNKFATNGAPNDQQAMIMEMIESVEKLLS
jgi:hypothetical protein